MVEPQTDVRPAVAESPGSRGRDRRHRSPWWSARQSWSAVIFLEPLIVGGVLLIVAGLFVFRRQFFNWTTMLFVLAAVVMFIPIRRYALPIEVGFALEPYRVLITGLLIALAVSLIRHGTSRWKPVVWGWPIAIFLWTMFASLMVNAVYRHLLGSVHRGLLEHLPAGVPPLGHRADPADALDREGDDDPSQLLRLRRSDRRDSSRSSSASHVATSF